MHTHIRTTPPNTRSCTGTVTNAQHNQESIELAVKEMDRLGLKHSGGGVYFGQLLGMADALTFTLGQNGCARPAPAPRVCEQSCGFRDTNMEAHTRTPLYSRNRTPTHSLSHSLTHTVTHWHTPAPPPGMMRSSTCPTGPSQRCEPPAAPRSRHTPAVGRMPSRRPEARPATLPCARRAAPPRLRRARCAVLPRPAPRGADTNPHHAAAARAARRRRAGSAIPGAPRAGEQRHRAGRRGRAPDGDAAI